MTPEIHGKAQTLVAALRDAIQAIEAAEAKPPTLLELALARPPRKTEVANLRQSNEFTSLMAQIEDNKLANSEIAAVVHGLTDMVGMVISALPVPTITQPGTAPAASTQECALTQALGGLLSALGR